MRIRIRDLQPKAYALMNRLDEYLVASELTETQRGLIKIRASQMNNCGYCLSVHTEAALKAGETQTRLNMLPLWHQAPNLYTGEERAMLQMTEEVTGITHGLSDDTYNKAVKLLSANRVAQVIMAIIAINAWNRIGVATRMEDDLDF